MSTPHSSGPRRAYPLDSPLPRLLAAQAARTPHAPAVVFEGVSLSYGALHARAARLAHQLVGLGAGPGVPVALVMERSLDMVVGLLGTLASGSAYVPVDPSYPAARIAFFLQDSDPAVVLTHAPALAAAGPLPSGRGALVAVDELEPLPETTPLSAPDSTLEPDDPAYIIYTSGSTGQPKGAVNTHRGIVNRLCWMQETFGLGADDAVLQKTPFSFDVSVWELFWPLLVGARLVLARPGGHKDPDYLARLIRREQITTLHFVPSMLRAFLDQADLGDFPSVRRVMASGEALTAELIASFYERMDVPLHNLYGPTEAAVDVSWWPAAKGFSGPFVPIGRPIANTTLHVLDEARAPVAEGEPGELYIGGVQLASGYWRRPELTAERFVQSPFGGPGERLYRTGDRARWLPTGDLEYLGRLDFQVKLRGFRIELGEIESVLAGHPQVHEVACMVRTDTPGDGRLVAYVAGPDAPLAAELKAYLRELLPEHMVPSAFVTLARMPLTPSGKLDRAALPRPLSAQERAAADSLLRAALAETPYWLAGAMAPAGALPPGPPETGRPAGLTRTLSESSTTALLEECGAAYGTTPEELVLAALVRALGRSTGEPGVRVDIREPLGARTFEDVPLTRLLGTEETFFPLTVSVPLAASPKDLILRVKEAYRGAPRWGVGFQLLRRHAAAPVREALSGAPPGAVRWLPQGLEGPSADQTPGVPTLATGVDEDRLSLRWTSPEASPLPAAWAALADDVLHTLEGLVAHCLAPDAGAYSPSDFRNARVSQALLDRIALLDDED